MNTKQLKDKILSMAMRGELVEQDPTDESAEVLLEKIKEEKAKLIAEKKIKKEKPLAEVEEDEIPYTLPQGWVWTRLGRLIVLQSGQDLKPQEYNDNKNGIPYITGASNIIDGKLLINRWTEFPKSIAKKGSILISCKGTVGKIAIVEEDEVHIARQLMGITPLNAVDDTFLKYYLHYSVEKLIQEAKGVIPGITRDDLISKLIPLPPLAEQKRIVEKIETLFAEVDKLEESRENLDGLKGKLDKKLLDMAMRGELVDQDPTDESAEILLEKIKEEKAKLIADKKIKKEKPLAPIEEDEIPYDLPQGWVWTRLGEVSVIGSGTTPKGEFFDEIGVPFYRVSDMNREENQEVMNYTESYLKSEYDKNIITSPAVVFPKNGGALYTNKRRYINEPCCVDLNTGYVIPTIYDLNYLFVYLSSLDFTKVAVGTAIPTVNNTILSALLIPLPPLAEQKRIVEKLETVRKIINESL